MKRAFSVLAALSSLALLAVPAAAQAAPALSAHPAKDEIVFGHSTTISGKLVGEPISNAGQTLRLRASPHPFDSFSTIDTATTGADGSYTFTVTPDRNTIYRVVTESAPATRSPDRTITVDERLRKQLAYLRFGRVHAGFASRHPDDLDWGGQTVYWFVARRSSDSFKLVEKTRTREVSPGVTRFGATFAVPEGRFRYLACFDAPGERAMDRPAVHAHCKHDDHVAANLGQYHGRGDAPAGFPFAAAVSRARSFITGRSGVASFAVMDSEGRLHGLHLHRRFISASVVKAMLLVAYLRKLDQQHKSLSSQGRSLLYRMIHVSDNSAASEVQRRTGNHRIHKLADRAGMTDFSLSGVWANAHISAADQARYFFYMDDLIPPQFDRFARSLLAGITSSQRWGIPHVAHGWKVFFKGGWRSTGRGQLVHQVARLERRHRRVAIAVMTDGDPTMGYGIGTIAGVAKRLLR